MSPNGMLVGAMVGALLGIKEQPKNMLERVWNLDIETDKSCRKRPDFLNLSKHAMLNIYKLI